MDRMLIGVDISKDSFSVARLDAEGKEYFGGLLLDEFRRVLEIPGDRY